MRLQFDYLSAYIDILNGGSDGFKKAREIIQKYQEYPILNWRLMFIEMQDQLREFDGEDIDKELELADNLAEFKSEEEKRKEKKKKAIK